MDLNDWFGMHSIVCQKLLCLVSWHLMAASLLWPLGASHRLQGPTTDSPALRAGSMGAKDSGRNPRNGPGFILGDHGSRWQQCTSPQCSWNQGGPAWQWHFPRNKISQGTRSTIIILQRPQHHSAIWCNSFIHKYINITQNWRQGPVPQCWAPLAWLSFWVYISNHKSGSNLCN